MIRRYVIFHGLWLACTLGVIWLLLLWTFDATKLSPEFFEKPWRAWFRFVFTLIIAGLLIGTQILVSRKFPSA